MSSRLMTGLLWSVGSTIAAMIILNLHTNSLTHTNLKADQTLQIAEKELGLDDSTTEDLTTPARALRIARASQLRSLQLQREMQQRIQDINDMNSYGDVRPNPDSTNIHKLPESR